MDELINASLTYPTVIYTILLGILIPFWLITIFAGLDIDIGADADVELDADIDGGEISGDGSATGVLHSLGAALGIGTVPITIPISLIVVKGWIIGVVGELLIWPIISTHFEETGTAPIMVGLIFGIILFAVMVYLSIQLTVITVAPLKDKFQAKIIHGRIHLIGKSVTITSLTVSEKGGSAQYIFDEEEDKGSDLILNVLCKKENELTKGSTAYIVDFDEQNNIYTVTP